MDSQTKTLLKLSIQEFKVARDPERDKMIKHVDKQLKNAEYFAAHYVQAGRIFLRLFKPRKLFTLKAYGFKAAAVQRYNGSNYNIFIHIFKGREVVRGYSEINTKSKTQLIKDSVAWMRENRPGQPVKYSDFERSILNMCRDQVTRINNKI